MTVEHQPVHGTASEHPDEALDLFGVPAHDHSAAANMIRSRQYYRIERGQKGPILTDNFKFIEASTMPVSGVYAGLEGLKIVVPKLLAMFDIARFTIKEVTGGGNHTVALLEIMSLDVDDTEIIMEVAEVFVWNRGKIEQIKPFWFDIAALERAIAAKQARAR